MGIGELSRRTGCNIETIRYYERIGLLPRPTRTAARYRVYGADDVTRLTFVRRTRELGFPIDEIRTLLRLAAGDGDACAEVQALAETHRRDVRSKISDLRAMDRALGKAIRECESGTIAGCPLIESLSTV